MRLDWKNIMKMSYLVKIRNHHFKEQNNENYQDNLKDKNSQKPNELKCNKN